LFFVVSVVSLFRKSKQQLREQMSARRPHLIKALERIQDFYMELKWDFQSWGMMCVSICFDYKFECSQLKKSGWTVVLGWLE